MNDTELLDWASEHVAEFQFYHFNKLFSMKYIDNIGLAKSILGSDLRDCICKAMVMETEQQNKTTATVERRPLTEEQIRDCLLQSNSLGDVIRTTYDAGPYDVTFVTSNAISLVRAIEKAHGIKEQ